MRYLKSAKIYLFFAVLLFVAKPFLGFSMFSRTRPPAIENIFIKAFTKRKQEFIEESSFDMVAVQKKLAEPVCFVFLRFCGFLNILFPTLFTSEGGPLNNYLSRVKLALHPPKRSYLLNCALVI